MADLRWAWLTLVETHERGGTTLGAAPLLSEAPYVR